MKVGKSVIVDFRHKYSYIDLAWKSFSSNEENENVSSNFSQTRRHIAKYGSRLLKTFRIMQQLCRRKRRESKEELCNSISKKSTQIYLLKKGTSRDRKAISIARRP